jgi:DNA-binding transcriptional regulator/RsmH inhibitor MraZ
MPYRQCHIRPHILSRILPDPFHPDHRNRNYSGLCVDNSGKRLCRPHALRRGSDYGLDLFQYRSVQPGRTPSWNVVADLETTAWLEAVQLASGDRLLLPAMLRKRVSWCAPKVSLPLLATIDADGGVTALPLSERQDEVAAIRAALEASDPEERAALAFAAMATYSQVSLQPDGRLRLSPPLALHLCSAADGWVWVGAHGNAIRLWSEEVWKSLLSTNSASLREAVTASRGATARTAAFGTRDWAPERP